MFYAYILSVMRIMEMPTISKLRTQLEKITNDFESLLDSRCEEEFIRYISSHETLRLQWLAREDECRRLQDKLNSAVKDISVLKNKLQMAKKMVDEEKIKRQKIVRDKNILSQQLNAVRRILMKDYYAELPDTAKKELLFLESSSSEYVDAISEEHREFSDFVCESNSANEKAVSKFSSSHSGSDLSDIFVLSTKSTPAKRAPFVRDLKKRRSKKLQQAGTPDIIENHENSPKKSLIMSTPNRVDVNRPDDFLMESKMSPISKDRLQVSTPRHHNFISRTFMMPESCTRCYRRIAFGRSVFKCMDCAIVVHPECRDDTLYSCKSNLTPTRTHRKMGSLSDYLCDSLPFVPSVVVTCVREIERRGMQESSLYGMLGTSSLVHRLLEDIRCKKEIRLNLINYDTHSICRTLINFFEHLDEPLIPRTCWKTFTDAVIHDARGDSDLVLAVSTLPRLNRDTLAFMVLHLHKVISVCGRSIEDLAVIFITVIFGHTGHNLPHACTIIRELILLPNTYWSRFTTPSSLLLTTIGSPIKNGFVEMLSSPAPMKKRRFFDTEPSL